MTALGPASKVYAACVEGAGFRDWGLGFRVWGLALHRRCTPPVLKVQGLGAVRGARVQHGRFGLGLGRPFGHGKDSSGSSLLVMARALHGKGPFGHGKGTSGWALGALGLASAALVMA